MSYSWVGGELKKKCSPGMNILELVAGYFGGVKVDVNVNSWNPYIRASNSQELWGYCVVVRELNI